MKGSFKQSISGSCILPEDQVSTSFQLKTESPLRMFKILQLNFEKYFSQFNWSEEIVLIWVLEKDNRALWKSKLAIKLMSVC